MTSFDKHRCAKLAQITGNTYKECREQFDLNPLDHNNIVSALSKAMATLGVLEAELKQLAK